MAGTINSLGLGSGVLTSDVIEKLKTNDEALIITPISNKITLQQQKSSALDLLKSLMTSFKGSVSALDDDALYQKRSVSGSSSSVSVTADSGVAIQSFSISNTVLAQQNVKESGQFASTSSTIATGSGTMTLSIDGTDYEIDYTSSTTLSSLSESINSIAGASVKASTLQVGENDYRLILTSVETGEDQVISIADSSGGTLKSELLAYDGTTNPTGMQEIQAARDASFKYNGVTISRSSNEIDDIITGVTINLLGETTSSANISISQDVTAISDELSMFVSNYNSLMSEINDMTTSDTEAGTVGIFNGDSTINSIRREITKILTSINDSGLSLGQFGIDLSQTGVMTFNTSTFTTKFNEDKEASEKFFSGFTTLDSYDNSTTTDGVFSTLSTYIESYTKSTGILYNLSNASTEAVTSLTESKTRSQELLDARYNAMTVRFSMYDSIISKLNNQFATLEQQINMAVNGTNS